LAGARNPIIITKAVGRDPLAVPALVALAETMGVPVFQDPGHNYMNFPADHPLHAGYEAAAHLEEADVILVVEADAPWYPQIKSRRLEGGVIQVPSAPLFSGSPIRGFPSDLTLGGAPRLTLEALAAAGARQIDPGAVAERRRRWESEHARLRQAWAARAKAVS